MSDLEEPGGPLNHHEELAKWAAAAPNPRGRKLTFSEKCGIAWALKTKGVNASTVAKAFNLSGATVSWLNHCLQPDRPHYADVWREYQGLGPDAFALKHYTPDLAGRLRRVKLKLYDLDENQTDIAPRTFGPDPSADKYAGPLTIDGQYFEIILREDGWLLLHDGVEHGAEWLLRAEGRKPFRFSWDAYDAAYELMAVENPRVKPGRPRK